MKDYNSLSNKELEREVYWEVIQEKTGIELTVNEELASDIYKKSFLERNNDSKVDFVHWFLIDFFGLDMVELSESIMPEISFKYRPYFKQKIYYGMNLLGDERFKKYCRNNVDIWRQERELI